MKMRRISRQTHSRARSGGSQDFWLSFSDLMSVLVLVFILVLFYILYKYTVTLRAYEDKRNEMLLVEAALSTKETELADAQASLAVREGELVSAQTELTEAQKELASQQLMLNLAQQAVEDSEAELAGKQTELDEALSLLSQRELAAAALEKEIGEKQAQIDTQQRQLEALVGVRTRIIETLSTTLRDKSISATVDPVNGSIMLESDVLFAYGKSDLTAEGKAYIDRFLPAYLSALMTEENESYISEIIIEGHTDPTDTYLKNLKLSQDRAYGVADYILSPDNRSLTSAQKNSLKALLTANGRSYSDPILDENGNVDSEASRRVVFKFRLTDEQMIQQMRDILETGN